MTYLRRAIDVELKKWAQTKGRKPLLLRGARQVGKSSAVRNLALSFASYLEVNSIGYAKPEIAMRKLTI